MAPEYGATCGFFGIDDKTLEYLRLTGREEGQIALVEAYAKEQGFWLDPDAPDPVFTDTLELDLASVVPSLAGPKRPQDKVALPDVDDLFNGELKTLYGKAAAKRCAVEGADHDIGDGDVVIAAITSCTNTSNPDVLIAAGLVARKANARGLKPKPWVKTSLAPGSQVVTDYLDQGRAAGRSRRARLRPRRLRLHHLHRQLGPARRADQQGDQRQRHRRRLGALGQPQLRRPRQPRRARQLPRQPAAGGRLRAQGHGDRGHHRHPDRHRQRRRRRLSQGHLADQPRDRRPASPPTSTAACSRRATPTSTRATRTGRRSTSTGSDTYQWRPGSTYVANPPYFEGMSDDPGAGHRHRRRQAARDPRRFGHHRPHQPGGLDQGGQPRRALPARAPGREARLQLLRQPPRQPRSDDARHLRQHPHQERDGPRRRRRHDAATPARRWRSTTRR